MRRERIGGVLLTVGLILALFVCVPLGWHLPNIRRVPSPNSSQDLTVLDDCHGTVCYVSPADKFLEDSIPIVFPITIIFVVAGYYLWQGKMPPPRG